MDIGNLFGGAVKAVLNTVTGGLSGTILNIIDDVVPGGLTPEQRAAVQERTETELTKREENAHKAAGEAERNLTDRISKLEGTAKDLLQMPYIGRLIIFLRGAQRPMWGYGTLYMDFQVFSQTWPIQPGPVEVAFWTINFLVLGFLFGERAIKNVAPLVLQLLGRGKNG